ncbi:MAG: helix-turn-helix transcriptional regulator [Woeseiaceae bacterium]|nr:helix-turn-helix transcriptional regulator [Woeseiaceae bacterium]
MDLSPTDIKLVSYDLNKADEKYDFKLSDILRRRNRPILFILDKDGDLVYSCLPENEPADEVFTATITPELIDKALHEARHLITLGARPMRKATRQVVVDKPGQRCALTVLDNQFWTIRIFELDGGVVDLDPKFAALIEPIGNPQPNALDLEKIKGLFRLSKREADVVEELVAGGTDKEIAKHLGISVETVRAYLKSVRAKLGVSTRTAIVSAVHNLNDSHMPSQK